MNIVVAIIGVLALVCLFLYLFLTVVCEIALLVLALVK